MKLVGLQNPFLLAPTTLVMLAALVQLPRSTTGLDLLVGNTRGDIPISMYSDGVFTPFLPEEVGLIAPDHLVLKDGYLYVSQGDSLNTSSIFRMNVAEGSYDEMFVKPGEGLLRPYGFDIYEGTIYVASFLSDQILMYSEETGDFMGEFAMGNGTEEGLCNGPNQLAIHDGKLYLTTQGSVAVDGVPEYGFASQIVVYDIQTGVGSVYVPQPEVLEGSLGFISMLGIIIGCDDKSAVQDDCTVYTSDFGGGLRAYKLESAELIYASGTTVNASSSGSLTMTDDKTIIIPIFSDEVSGSLLQFDAMTGAPMGISDESPVWVGPTTDMARPIGVLFLGDEETPPAVDEDEDAPTLAPGDTSEGCPSRVASVVNVGVGVVLSFSLFSMW